LPRPVLISRRRPGRPGAACSPARGDLAGVPIGVVYHSGSHFATLQALEHVIAPGEVALPSRARPRSGWTRCPSGRSRRPRAREVV